MEERHVLATCLALLGADPGHLSLITMKDVCHFYYVTATLTAAPRLVRRFNDVYMCRRASRDVAQRAACASESMPRPTNFQLARTEVT